MLTFAQQKRLDKLEGQLTPKELAIKLADDMRKHSSANEFIKAVANRTYREAPFIRPFSALAEQAEVLYAGEDPDEIRARNKLSHKLHTEFHALLGLISKINETIANKMEVAGLKAALELSTLETLILQDTLGWIASQVAPWVKEYKTADADEEEERQVVLKELAGYVNVSFAERPSDSLPPETGDRLSVRSLLEHWVSHATKLIADVFAHKAAIQVVEETYFDGHPILFRDVEATLTDTIKTIEEAVATLNDYLKTRADLLKLEWDHEAREDRIASAVPGEWEGQLAMDIGAIQNQAGKHLAGDIASRWVNDARDDAMQQALDPKTGEAQAFYWRRLQEAARVKR